MTDPIGVEGYPAEVSLAAGTELGLYLSSISTTEATVDLVRLDKPGPTLATTTTPIQPQLIERGNWFDMDVPATWVDGSDGVILWAFTMPTRPGEPDQVVLGGWDDDQGGIALAISRGYAELWVSGERGEHRLREPQGVRPWAWYLLVGVVSDGELRLYQRPVVTPYNQRLAPYLDWDESGTTHLTLADPGKVHPGPFRMGAASRGGRPDYRFDGKIDLSGVLHGRPTDADVEELLSTGSMRAHTVVAAWDPAAGIGPHGVDDTLVDLGAGGFHGRGRNKPTRLVTGRSWAGRDDSFELDKSQYSAVSFASDALTDCRWDRSMSIAVPASAESGVYAARVCVAGRPHAELPFVVRATPPKNRVLVVLPTMTYIAESNDRLSQLRLAVGTPIDTSSPYQWQSDLGGSTGDVHPDGTGVCYASRRRPLREFHSGVRSTALPGPGTFEIDLDLLRFLHRREIEFDVISDEDLHREGPDALAPYRVVLTGSRPVYATADMLEAFDGYVAAGGRLVCLGGGGFYWVTSVDPRDPAVVEVRRGENGMRAWQIGPGELYHATTGERGGIWRGRGRPPQRLLGVGHAARGFGPGTAFRRMPDSHHKAVSWIFDGVPDELFGQSSRLPGGVASMEIDRYDRTWGSPPHARILASSTRLSDDYHQAIEETLFTFAGRGGRENEHVRADTVFFTTPNDGAVFAAGSAGWCAALAVDDFENPIARISTNLIRGLLAPKVPGRRFDDEDDLESAPGLARRPLLSALRLDRASKLTPVAVRPATKRRRQ